MAHLPAQGVWSQAALGCIPMQAAHPMIGAAADQAGALGAGMAALGLGTHGMPGDCRDASQLGRAVLVDTSRHNIPPGTALVALPGLCSRDQQLQLQMAVAARGPYVQPSTAAALGMQTAPGGSCGQLGMNVNSYGATMHPPHGLGADFAAVNAHSRELSGQGYPHGGLLPSSPFLPGMQGLPAHHVAAANPFSTGPHPQLVFGSSTGHVGTAQGFPTQQTAHLGHANSAAPVLGVPVFNALHTTGAAVVPDHDGKGRNRCSSKGPAREPNKQTRIRKQSAVGAESYASYNAEEGAGGNDEGTTATEDRAGKIDSDTDTEEEEMSQVSKASKKRGRKVPLPERKVPAPEPAAPALNVTASDANLPPADLARKLAPQPTTSGCLSQQTVEKQSKGSAKAAGQKAPKPSPASGSRQQTPSGRPPLRTPPSRKKPVTPTPTSSDGLSPDSENESEEKELGHTQSKRRRGGGDASNADKANEVRSLQVEKKLKKMAKNWEEDYPFVPEDWEVTEVPHGGRSDWNFLYKGVEHPGPSDKRVRKGKRT